MLAGSGGESRSGGEGACTEGAHPSKPPHPRLPARSADERVGRALASLALGREDEHSSLAIVDPPRVRVPPEPFRYAGGTIIRRAILRKEEALEKDRGPGPITRVVSAIPERIGIHVGR